MRFLFAVLFLFFVNQAVSQDVLGQWKTFDEDTGEEKSVVEIYTSDGKIYGKVDKLLKDNLKGARCTRCKGALKNQKVKGMVIIEGLSKTGEKYTGGTIIDPENGKTYDAKIWIENDEPDVLLVSGYITFFNRTQEWIRLKN